MPKLRHRRLAAALVLLGATGAALAGPVGQRPGQSPPECKLEIARHGAGVALTAVAHAGRSTSGRYDLRVSGRGTDIRQGGPFDIGANRTARLGTVTMGAGSYDVELDLVVDGDTISCSRRIGGGI